jgi:ABC-type branched-subunit amino acid transport system permease subunit
MRAMRDDSLAAGAVGVEVPMLRMTAFLLSAVFGGAAGVLYAGLIRLRGTGFVQHRHHVPAAGHGDHRWAARV